MDIYCPRCGEPYDVVGAASGDDMSRTQFEDMKKGRGCPSCHKLTDEQIKEQHGGKRPARAVMTEALLSVLGDDVDGLACELEDAEALGLLRDE